jgi:hypothetical protein
LLISRDGRDDQQIDSSSRVTGSIPIRCINWLGKVADPF